jgi:hypothetical protein
VHTSLSARLLNFLISIEAISELSRSYNQADANGAKSKKSPYVGST